MLTDALVYGTGRSVLSLDVELEERLTRFLTAFLPLLDVDEDLLLLVWGFLGLDRDTENEDLPLVGGNFSADRDPGEVDMDVVDE